MSQQFGVWCAISGGVTGNCGAWLKSNGEIVLYDSKEEAETRASECSRLTQGSFTRHTYEACGYGALDNE